MNMTIDLHRCEKCREMTENARLKPLFRNKA